MKGLITALFVLFLLLVMIGCRPRNSSGKALYEANCGNCHLETGEGVGELIPPLQNSSLLAENPGRVACMVRNGVVAEHPEEAVFENYTMPPNEDLSDIEITNILNYARGEWSPSKESVTLTEVKKALSNCN